MPFWSNAFRDFTDAGPPPDAGNDVGRRDACAAGNSDDDRNSLARRRMVEEQLRCRDVTDGKVLGVIGRLDRERFVPAELRHQAYRDHPLPIGLDQTISQPYIVGLMTQLVRPASDSRALEVGVGSGYQTAILAELCRDVYGVEILEPLATAARKRLAGLGYQNVAVRCGDGYQGWPEHAAVRRYRRQCRAGPRSAAAARPACPRRPAGDPRRPLLSGTPLDREAV